jgi:hypothetical protein
MANKQWGIWVSGNEEGWLTDDGYYDKDGDWHTIPAVYETKGEATAEAKWFNKGSKHTYTVKAF